MVPPWRTTFCSGSCKVMARERSLVPHSRCGDWGDPVVDRPDAANRAGALHDYRRAARSRIESESTMMPELRTLLLFFVTAVAEIVGCYLPYLWLRQGKSGLLLVPAVVSLASFAWLLSLHPTAAGRVYAAYGGVYIVVAIVWLWLVEGVRPTMWDISGSVVALAGMAIIMFAPVDR